MPFPPLFIMLQYVNELNNAYPDQMVWVIMTGTSLKGFPWERLKDYTTIAVNDAILHMTPTLHVINDRKLVGRYGDGPAWKGRPPWRDTTRSRAPEWRYADGQIIVARRACVRALDKDPVGRRVNVYQFNHKGPDIKMKEPDLYCRSTVATAAIQLAWRVGASMVGLLGFDCYQRGGVARYFWEPFDDKEPYTKQGRDNNYVKDMQALREWADKVAPEMPIVNYSKKSACPVWPRKDWREVFSE
jgi:hypothetical protein